MSQLSGSAHLSQAWLISAELARAFMSVGERLTLLGYLQLR